MRPQAISLSIFAIVLGIGFATQDLGPQERGESFFGVYQSYSTPNALSGSNTAAGIKAVGKCENCAPDSKCCEPKDASPFCVPKDASCCGRTWCTSGFVCCEYGDSNGGCCPTGGRCAVGGRGCCRQGESCYGPFTCYDFGSTQCTMGEVDKFLCCDAAHPFCRWDSNFGYGCFDLLGSQPLPTGTLAGNVGYTVAAGTAAAKTATVASGTLANAPSSEHTSVLLVSQTVPPTVADHFSSSNGSLSVTSLTVTWSGTYSPMSDSNTTNSKLSSSVRAQAPSTVKYKTTDTGGASPTESSADLGVCFAKLNEGLAWGAIIIWLARAFAT